MEIGKKYKKISENKEYTVTGVEGSFFILNDGVKVSAERLADKTTFTEVNPASDFFSLANNAILGAFNTFKPNQNQSYESENVVRVEAKRDDLNDDSMFYSNANESAYLGEAEFDPEVEKRKLLQKYNVQSNPVAEAAKQNEMMKNLLDGVDVTEIKNEFLLNELKDKKIHIDAKQQPQQQTIVEDPIISLLKKTKRVNKFKAKIEIEELLPKNEFIQMIEESYDNSAIDYLVDEMYNKILNDKSHIKDMIKQQMTLFVNKKHKKKSTSDAE